MAALKEHATFGFWRDEEVTGSPRDAGAMGSMGRLGSLDDLPGDKAMAGHIRKAAALCAEGKPKRPAPKPSRRSTCLFPTARRLIPMARGTGNGNTSPQGNRAEDKITT